MTDTTDLTTDLPANTSTPGSLSSGSASGTLDAAGDHDWYQVPLTAGHNYIIDLMGAPSGNGTLSDPFLSLYNNSGTFVTSNDDGGFGLDSQLAIHASANATYFADAGAFANAFSGTFTMHLTDLGAGTAGVHFQSPAFSEAMFGSSPAGGGWSSENTYPRMLADVNNDGQADIIGFGDAGTYVSFATPGGHFASPQLGLAQFGAGSSAGGWTSYDSYPRTAADVNGDGNVDLVGFGSNGVYTALGHGNGTFDNIHFALAGFGSAASGGGWTSQNIYPRVLADVNGDERADIVAFASDGVYVAEGQADGTFSAPVRALQAFGNDTAAGGWTSQDAYPRLVADVNGDGRADLVAFASDGVYVALGQANGTFASAVHASTDFGTNAGWTSQNIYPRELADTNHDGHADIVGFGANGVFYALGQANGTFGPTTQDLASLGTGAGGWTSQDLYPRVMGDVTGDQNADIVAFGSAGTYVSPAHDFITV